MGKNEIKAIADKRENFGYTKQLTHEELTELKDQLSEKAIKVKKLQSDLKEYSKEIKEELKPILAEKNQLIDTIKAKAKFVTEMCSIVFDQEKGIAEYYSEESGEVVCTRPLTSEEKQLNIKFLKAQGE